MCAPHTAKQLRGGLLKVFGSTALVTGAGRRVGRAITLALAQNGANLAVHYNRSESDAAETVKLATSFGVRAESFQADLVDAGQTVKLFDDVQSSFGSINIIINNASAFSKDTLQEVSVETWESYMAVNLRAPFLLAQEMRRRLPGEETGKVISLNDWRTARANRFTYGVSKAALSGLTRSLAVAMAPNVQVNELALGAILPPADTVAETGRPAGEHVSKVAPAGRMGTLNEVASAVISLIENDFITGETVHIDGGRHIR